MRNHIKPFKYFGKKLEEGKKHPISAYIPTPKLIDVVNITIALKERPLLLMGEPGCGKTLLAEAVAYEIYGEDYKNKFFRWDIKSTSKAKDGLYHYDALRRLNDIHINVKRDLKNQINIDNLELDAKGSYITSRALAKAFKASTPEAPSILLIDEIDKASIDFPNDLLLELSKKEIVITETGKTIPPPAHPPLIFITSNNEKELPPAFLRRCVFHYIKFPEENLAAIVQAHFGTANNELINKAVGNFLNIRKKFSSIGKPPSTSELIDWYRLIDKYHNKKALDELVLHNNL